MNHEKDQNHLAGCSFILRAGQLCGFVCVWPMWREWGLCKWISECVVARIKISPLMSNECVGYSVFIIRLSAWMKMRHASSVETVFPSYITKPGCLLKCDCVSKYDHINHHHQYNNLSKKQWARLRGIKGQKLNIMWAGMEHKNHVFVMLNLSFYIDKGGGSFSREPARMDRPHCGCREGLFLSGRCGGRVRRGMCSWLQSATSPRDASKSYTLDI